MPLPFLSPSVLHLLRNDDLLRLAEAANGVVVDAEVRLDELGRREREPLAQADVGELVGLEDLWKGCVSDGQWNATGTAKSQQSGEG